MLVSRFVYTKYFRTYDSILTSNWWQRTPIHTWIVWRSQLLDALQKEKGREWEADLSAPVLSHSSLFVLSSLQGVMFGVGGINPGKGIEFFSGK